VRIAARRDATSLAGFSSSVFDTAVSKFRLDPSFARRRPRGASASPLGDFR
jgi:hypothetical protein